MKNWNSKGIDGVNKIVECKQAPFLFPFFSYFLKVFRYFFPYTVYMYDDAWKIGRLSWVIVFRFFVILPSSSLLLCFVLKVGIKWDFYPVIYYKIFARGRKKKVKDTLSCYYYILFLLHLLFSYTGKCLPWF